MNQEEITQYIRKQKQILQAFETSITADIRAFTQEQIRTLEAFLTGSSGFELPAEPTEVPGVDVSHWEETIDWSKVAGDGYRFAIIKATSGINSDDPNLDANAHGAKGAGLRVNYYHWGTPYNIDGDGPTADATAEAAYFLQRISRIPAPTILRFPANASAAVWLDLEQEVPNLDKQQGLDWILTWCTQVEKVWPVGLYTSERWLEKEAKPADDSLELLVRRKDGSKRPFWVARYGSNDGNVPPDKYDPDEKVPSEWGTWDIWQYTSKGQIAGINANCDLNLARLIE